MRFSPINMSVAAFVFAFSVVVPAVRLPLPAAIAAARTPKMAITKRIGPIAMPDWDRNLMTIRKMTRIT